MTSSYSALDLNRFLSAIDDALEEPVGITIIGGAAAALCYGATRETSDIDTFENLDDTLNRAIAAATEKTGLRIPVNYAAVAQFPHACEGRRRPAPLGLKKLQVFVPDPYDLALMKLIRGEENDLQVIAEMHDRQPLDLVALLTRADTEMRSILNPYSLMLNVRLLVRRVFGASGLDICDRFFHDDAWRRV